MLTQLLNSYQVATGAGNDTIRIWDMCSINSLYTIPAHVSNVLDVWFFHANDLYFKCNPPSDMVINDVDDSEATRDSPEKGFALAEEEWRYWSGLFFASSGWLAIAANFVDRCWESYVSWHF